MGSLRTLRKVLEDLADLCGILETGLFSKYGLAVKISEHIDICAVSSFDRHPAVLINHYPINSGTSGLILYAESLQEIMADKMLALALRPNRVKNRDLWDILWLHSQVIALDRTPIGNIFGYSASSLSGKQNTRVRA